MNFRPIFHFTPVRNWMNDPNGLCFYKGEYHLFYQHNPHNPYWGNMTWGHAKSKDLFSWEHLPFALEPGKGLVEDRDGCFSGSAFTLGEDLYLAYTGVYFNEKEINEFGNTLPKDDKEFVSSQIFAVSKDGISFEKLKNPIIKAPHSGDTAHFRDPKVWEKDGMWYMVVGSKKDEKGKVLIYSSPDLKTWNLRGEYQKNDLGRMWECPDLFSLNNRDVLIISPMGIGTDGQENQSGYLVGDFNHENIHFNFGEFQRIDDGFEVYAPQTFTDDSGRRIMISWLIMHEPFEGNDWTGMMTLPREVTLKNNQLYFSPVKEFEGFKDNLRETIEIKDELKLENNKNLYDFQIEFSTDNNKEIILFEEKGKGLYLNFDSEEMVFTLDRSLLINGMDSLATYGTFRKSRKLKGDKINLRVIVDINVVEIYINNGESVMTAVVNPRENQKNIRLKGNFENFKIWDLIK